MRIKGIPESEQVLFSEKVDLIDFSVIKIPTFKRVHFAITDKAVYIKIANVLIDLTGGIVITPLDVANVVVGKHLWSPKLTFLGTNNKKTILVIPKKFFSEVIKLLTSIGFSVVE